VSLLHNHKHLANYLNLRLIFRVKGSQEEFTVTLPRGAARSCIPELP